MPNVLGRLAVTGLILVSLSACASLRSAGSPTPGSGGASSPGAGSPGASPAAGYPAPQQAADAGARTSGGVPCSDRFPGQQFLLVDSVGVFNYVTGPCGPGGHAILSVWVFRDAGAWHPYTWAASQYANLPTGAWGSQIPMHTGGGCVNARAAPSTTARVVTCLGASDTVIPAGSSHEPWYPPIWAAGRIWWYVFRLTGGSGAASQGTPLGWVALEYLVCGDGPHNLNLSCRS